jgi:ABC-type polysaccharide/polyol phosphate transport system ATPase subunit
MNIAKVVEIENVEISYRRAHHRISTLKQAAIETVKRRIEYEQFFALKGISFDISRGETVSIIGGNGAGKSTLLKVVARVLPPTSGRVRVRGRVAPMIELGAGFNQELTGAENIVLFGVLLGNSSKTMKAKVSEIAAWAGLEDHIHLPVRTYSTGMIARLGFAVATFRQSNLLIIDEVLAVGDADFQLKSKARMLELIHGGEATVLVSHDLETVAELATKVLWLDHGKQIALGSPSEVIDAYRKS